mmetsp:Transcript_20181/g.81096  ORF Transcript_20181/g.81096 Transcript_20181/m.81096 type:complete len:108 (-) Transcript_20181:2272-2595(-)
MGGTTEEVQMTEASLKQMKKAKVFKQHEKRVNCIDFSMDGSYLISSGDDEALLLYNCLEGTIHKTIKSKKSVFSFFPGPSLGGTRSSTFLLTNNDAFVDVQVWMWFR